MPVSGGASPPICWARTGSSACRTTVSPLNRMRCSTVSDEHDRTCRRLVPQRPATRRQSGTGRGRRDRGAGAAALRPRRCGTGKLEARRCRALVAAPFAWRRWRPISADWCCDAAMRRRSWVTSWASIGSARCSGTGATSPGRSSRTRRSRPTCSGAASRRAASRRASSTSRGKWHRRAGVPTRSTRPIRGRGSTCRPTVRPCRRPTGSDVGKGRTVGPAGRLGASADPPDWAGGLRETWKPGEAPRASAPWPSSTTRSRATGRRAMRRGRTASRGCRPSLHFGEIAPRQLLHAVQARGSEQTAFAWVAAALLARFRLSALFHFPQLAGTAAAERVRRASRGPSEADRRSGHGSAGGPAIRSSTPACASCWRDAAGCTIACG